MGIDSSINADTGHGYNGQYLKEFSVLWRVEHDKSLTYPFDPMEPPFSDLISEFIVRVVD